MDKAGKIRLSVLVTFYNQEKYVDKAIKSILDQKVDFEYEILVGDDGSEDSTQEKVKEWIKKYPSMIRMYIMERDDKKTIPGYRASRNRINLLKHVKGQYFIFLDGDDYYDDNYKFSKQVKVLDSKDNSDCIACSHNVDSLFPDGTRKQNTLSKYKEGKYGAHKYWRELYFHTNSLLVRSSVINALPLEILNNNFNDNLITYSIIQHGKIYYLPESMAVYSQTGDGIWTSGNKVINLIRNLFLFDLCNKINPKMKLETIHRLGGNFFRIFQIRKEIKNYDLALFKAEAIDKKLLHSYKWINYHSESIFSRFLISGNAIAIAIISKIL